MDQVKETTLNNSMVKVKFAMWKYQMKEIFCGKELWGIGDGTIEREQTRANHTSQTY
jgi:hypothetical protein